VFCPECGKELLYVAKGSLFKNENDDRTITDLFSPRFKASKASEDWNKSETVGFYACGSCKRLFLVYGTFGFYFDILGSLTDETIASWLATKIKE